MIRRMRFVSSIVKSRFLHLTIGLFLLYGLSMGVTHTTPFDRILDSLAWRAHVDYFARETTSPEEDLEAEFLREKYEERLASLTQNRFDYQELEQLQDFLFRRGFVYEVWEDDEGFSYLLAPILENGSHVVEVPEKVDFDYYVLGDKKIAPWQEYRNGNWPVFFVSEGEQGVYLHRDSIEQILEQYFNFLWAMDAQDPRDFRWQEWPLTYSLYRDLDTICEDVFTDRLYRSKRVARAYFIEEGFDLFLPTMLAMAARMVADGTSDLSSTYRYERAYLTGLYLEPNYTMLSMLGYQSEGPNPPTRRLWREFNRRLDLRSPDSITLNEISRVAQDIMMKLEYSQGYSR